jgi:alpha-glucosidase
MASHTHAQAPARGLARLARGNDPIANPKSVVTLGNARFTILTPQLIRMEWADGARFEDHASLVFINRNLDAPTFTHRTDADWDVIETDQLLLRYKAGAKFDSTNLSIKLKTLPLPASGGGSPIWKPGMKDTANLRGTTRTLDDVEGATQLEPGLCSKDGWTLVDDSRRPLFDTSDWAWVQARDTAKANVDWYFFGYGHNYKQLLYDYTRVAGKIPMPPRFAFGLWWSRYWSYTDQEFKQLVEEFEQHDIPLDVLVIDMDWHKTFDLRWRGGPKDQAGQRLGWTGYTWDPNIFPDPEGFLKWTDERGLRTPLNLHPASGIQPHEDHYPEMARAMGIDPASQQYVPFDITDKKFATNYMNLMIRPLEKQGVDFWWLDWQQWGTTKIPGVTPTWWLNYVFFTDMERQGKARPLLFHRWGGLGNHRYEIGFSGDVISVWKSLAFQPYFTATAANVGYGYWSHDIGGHMPGEVSPELYTRWIQFGAFSPILRTHTTKNALAERRIWAYPPENFNIMRDMILLRYSLIPYIYTASREAYDTGISICRPMYYDYPDAEEAYAFKDQYMFGDDMLVAPIATPVSTDTLLAQKKIWLPKGEWIEWFTGARLHGPAVLTRSYSIDEMPVFVKAGAIIPMQPKMKHVGEKPVDPLILNVFPGDSGETRIYEDSGNSTAYQKDEGAWTTVKLSTRKGIRTITISPPAGSFPGIAQKRSYEIRLQGSIPPKSVSLSSRSSYDVWSVTEDWKWEYDGSTLTTIIRTPEMNYSGDVVLNVHLNDSSANSALTDNFAAKMHRLNKAKDLINTQWPKEWSPDTLVHAVQTGNRININPSSAVTELKGLDVAISEVVREIKKLDIDSTVAKRALLLLKSLDRQ